MRRSASHHRRSAAVVALGLGAAGLATISAGRPAAPASASATVDSQLFTLTNQDRTSNGVPALAWYAPLGSIAENGKYGACGFNVQGRAQDMLDRNYFAHPILGCGHYAWTMMTAYGIPYRSAGENIAWNTQADQGGSVSAANSWLMNSPVHRANILNPGFDHIGIGSANSGGAAWSGGGAGALTHVSIYVEDFARLGNVPPVAAPAPIRPPTGPPAPKPAPPVAKPAPRPPAAARPAAPARKAAPPAVKHARAHRPAPRPAGRRHHPVYGQRRHLW